jgi:hypothetical protein
MTALPNKYGVKDRNILNLHGTQTSLTVKIVGTSCSC